jgi:hypothetical protein
MYVCILILTSEMQALKEEAERGEGPLSRSENLDSGCFLSPLSFECKKTAKPPIALYLSLI